MDFERCIDIIVVVVVDFDGCGCTDMIGVFFSIVVVEMLAILMRSLVQSGGGGKWIIEVVSMVGQEVGGLVGVERGELGGESNVDLRVGGWRVVAVVFVIGDWMIGTPLDHEAVLLDEGLIVFNAEGFNPGNGCVGHRERCPLVARDASSSREGHKIIVALGVASGVEGNGAHGPCLGGVGRVVVFEHLDVGAELKFHVIIVGVRAARDERLRAEVFGNAVAPGKLV